MMNREESRNYADYTRYVPGQSRGHYESYFLRANHPDRPHAFWIRYTIFSPDGNPGGALSELWFVYFDGETKKHVAAKSELPVSAARFSAHGLDVSIGESFLRSGRLTGSIRNASVDVKWDLSYDGEEAPLYDFPRSYYDGGFPKAKVLVGLPLARFTGIITINGRNMAVDRWIGSENHNWGSKHTDHYAWGQVAGFDNRPDSFLELATARIKIGPVWTPFMTPLVLRHGGGEYALNRFQKTMRRGRFRYFDWTFSAAGNGVIIDGRIRAGRDDFVCLPYYNPPGGVKYCINSKIARCDLRIRHEDGRVEELIAKHRAAFEILTDSGDHGFVLAV
ncbi:MAG TPA: hypothetical protein P5295_09545 [Spirochaetota bacterium]|nr:hypothetical protein [Spirochaetota bacterium]